LTAAVATQSTVDGRCRQTISVSATADRLSIPTDDFRLTDDCDRRLPTVDCLTTATGDYRLSTV
jgi:hypothetical protein